MSKICRKIIDHPSAWTSSNVRKEQIALRLSPAHLEAIDLLLKRTRHLAPQAVDREAFSHPTISALTQEILDIVKNGRSLLVLAGLTHDRYSEEDFERVLWGLGTHLGTAVVQSPNGDRIGHVKFTPRGPENPAGRAYRSQDELHMHVDTEDVVGLMCVQKAKSGGESHFVSSIALHNEILRTRPELLEPLYEGYYLATHESLMTDKPLTPYKLPIFCYVEGLVSCAVKTTSMNAAGKISGGLPTRLIEALDYLLEVANREDMRLSFVLEPGEIALWNNWTNLHARSSFTDHDEPERKRHLLRLWLSLPKGTERPMIPVYHQDLVAGAASYPKAASR